jgi:hypothetical protein
MNRTVASAALVLIGLVSACGGDGQLSVDYDRACTLLTSEEAEDALGVPVYGGEPDFDRTIPASFCIWVAEGSPRSEGEATFAIWVSEGSDPDSIEEFESASKEDDADPVEGLGDEAYFHVQGTAEVPWLEVRVGNHVSTIGLSLDDDHPLTADEARAIEREAGEHVAPRL